VAVKPVIAAINDPIKTPMRPGGAPLGLPGMSACQGGATTPSVLYWQRDIRDVRLFGRGAKYHLAPAFCIAKVFGVSVCQCFLKKKAIDVNTEMTALE